MRLELDSTEPWIEMTISAGAALRQCAARNLIGSYELRRQHHDDGTPAGPREPQRARPRGALPSLFVLLDLILFSF